MTRVVSIPGVDQSLAVAGSMAGSERPVGGIWIGRNGIRPLGNPFVVTR